MTEHEQTVESFFNNIEAIQVPTNSLPTHYDDGENVINSDVVVSWNSKFAFAVALRLEGSGDPLGDILNVFNLTREDYVKFIHNAAFVNAVERYRNMIRVEGVDFKLKCKIMSEIWLNDIDKLVMRNVEASAASKVDLFKHITNVAGFVPKTTGVSAGDGSANGAAGIGGTGGVSITINLDGGTRAPRGELLEGVTVEV